MRRLLIVAALALSAVTTSAYSLLTFEQITVAGTAVGFTAATITAGGIEATRASCRLETAEVRYTINGTTPTSTVGTLMEVGDVLSLNGHDVLKLFKAIRTGSSAQLDCNASAP